MSKCHMDTISALKLRERTLFFVMISQIYSFILVWTTSKPSNDEGRSIPLALNAVYSIQWTTIYIPTYDYIYTGRPRPHLRFVPTLQ